MAGSTAAPPFVGKLLQGCLLTSLVLSLTFSKLWPAVVVFGVLTLSHRRYGHGLSRFPGPFWASFTNLWQLQDAYRHGHTIPSFVRLHEVYGDVVRLGPKTLSFASPVALTDILGSSRNLAKSGKYVAFEAHGKGDNKENIFSTRNVTWHAKYREAVLPGFDLKYLGQKETAIDDLIRLLLKQLDHDAEQGDQMTPIDLPQRLQFFAFDAGGVFSFSRPYGFLEKKVDIDGIMESVRIGTTHLSRLSQVPFFQVLLDKNPLTRYFGFIAPPMAFAKKYLPTKRIATRIKTSEKACHHNDILDAYLAAHKENPRVVTENEIIDLGLMIVVPSSEALRAAMSVFVFQMLKHPAALKKLQKELDVVLTNRNMIPSWDKISTQFPYLDACIKETLRIHPPPGSMLERVVPPGGLIICGQYVPAGTLVGCSPWVIHRHKPTFGEDTDTFRPERWLDVQDEDKKKMEKSLCTFGAGSRSCLGADIGRFEIYKIAATLFNRYDLILEKPNEDLKVFWGNMVSVDFRVRLRQRHLQDDVYTNGETIESRVANGRIA